MDSRNINRAKSEMAAFDALPGELRAWLREQRVPAVLVFHLLQQGWSPRAIIANVHVVGDQVLVRASTYVINATTSSTNPMITRLS